ncbi:AMP-binding enzyme [Aspergillus parasiticus SU-1]|uniref:AMP-binding enzyme n=1 Tax=Aspergillus parasiticus (strain ATCC 56775 / NRRL 5862 / SRRC 143 / SU-1) TaxID=1403190 RepID=A0A0F0IPI8_ASPPU|nr:AMP-binding enzyme [Aspergillus parasiticus SU-1]
MPSQVLTHEEEYDLAARQGKGLAQQFFDHVFLNPSAVAVVDGDTNLTYQDLHERAAVLARGLQRGNLRTEEPVGVVVQHGISDVVAQIAILYAAATCVPMDPTLPDLQIKGRLDRLKARYILVDRANQHRDLPFHPLIVDDSSASFSKSSYVWDNEEPMQTTLEHRTHIIHTSGTTSEPKAVQIAARSILQVVFHAPFEPLYPTDRVAHVNNSSFDVSLFDIWAPLLRGACIVVVSKVTLLDLETLAAYIDRQGITVMATTTAILNLAASVYPRAFEKLRLCFIGGEAANISAIETIFQAGPPTQLINAYGPTECCIFCLAHRVTIADVQAGVVSIGKPIGRTLAYICDEAGRPVPDGHEGELLIGGAGVSPGYINQPDKNRASFVAIEGSDCQRFYRTGDIVRRRVSDGQIDYVGRRDHQVKVRGFRIELEAVESAIMKTGQFSEAVALKVEAGSEGAGSILVAFAVALSGTKPHAVLSAVDMLKAVLPDYMVPKIELISKMPVNSHAKVDRKYLEQLFRNRWAEQHIDMDNEDSTRGKLSNLWASILGVPVPASNDNADFFLLGATSMQASLLISRIQKTFNVQVSLLTLYDNSSLIGLAGIIEERILGTQESFCKESERHMWLEDSKLADSLVPPSDPPVDWCRDTEGRVFLTGATGFVGSFLLADLLRQPNVHQVGCLVRAVDPATGLRRLQNGLAKYDLWENQFRYKLLPLCGTLEDRYLGLGPDRFQEIAHWASVIFHLGARVNYTQPYSLHRPANVQGTVNVLRLACAGRSKALHYVSSISCFGPTGFITGTRTVMENEPLLRHLEALPYDHGYAQSQWVVENMLQRLMDNGFPIVVYRPGFITGHSQTGACNPDDFLSRLIIACGDMGSYPLLPNQRKEFVPVDYVNAVILHIASSTATAVGRVYHIVPPNRDLSLDMNDSMELVGSLAEENEFSVRGVSYQQWVQELDRQSPERLRPLQPMLTERLYQGLTRWELYENMPVYDTTNTRQALESYPGGLKFPVLDSELMQKYIRYLQIRSASPKEENASNDTDS